MTIPPFPSQDLAKLVLGYLAEEQLMTAYDEFLQASPYLEALGNEYDRILMTSLKNILAEYRAVKIYVETCKPFVLRKKIFQCSNLLEIVKFLIQYVDINKLQVLENSQNKPSFEKQSSQTSLRKNNCDVCSSLDSCVCKIKNCSIPSTPSNTHISMSSLENSVEATPLSELPGHHVTCWKKNVRVSNKELSEGKNVVQQNEITAKPPSSNEALEKGLLSHSNSNLTQKPDSLETLQKDEFNSVLNEVCKKKESLESVNRQRVSMAGYNEFATGVKSGGNAASIIVPDSSTSENLQVQIPVTKETENTISLEKSSKVTKRQTRTQYLLKVANVKNNVSIQPTDIVSICTVNNSTFNKVQPKKSEDSKIRILSDIKVDKTFKNTEGSNKAVKPPILRNATSTPLMQMQTIVINGTPVYKHTALNQNSFTKDEIMAMPTIIVAPRLDPSKVSMIGQPGASGESLYIPTSDPIQVSKSDIVDFTSENTAYVGESANVISQTGEEHNLLPPIDQIQVPENKESSHAKAGDITSASAPKGNTVMSTTDTSTPQSLPLLRKASSTPRRTSHIRVLDFATPRRILHETINECVTGDSTANAKEVIVSRSPNLQIPMTLEVVPNTDTLVGNSEPLKETSVTNKLQSRTANWDADLRALATANKDHSIDLTSSPKKKSVTNSAKKVKQPKNQSTRKSIKTSEEKSAKKKRTSKVKLPMKMIIKEEEAEIITIPDDIAEIPIKPTIKVIVGDNSDRIPHTAAEPNKSQNKSNNEDIIDTPEMERMSLQNEIGAKLNISDLLQTPYKQALYDIQMETPRFLGPDIPDDPMSDIKIMNIPTPRFLNAAATPSSYSSRPTDYSSGGSYYKPDDQDYLRIHDDLDCPVSSTKEAGTNEMSSNKDSDDSKEKENMKPTRPVRECTKNISYYNLANMKTKNSESKEDIDSSLDSTAGELMEKSLPITPRNKEIKVKPDKKGSSKKRKTPVKKDISKSFMKIKPRRPTPTKNYARGKRKLSDPPNHSKVQTRKKAANKEVKASASPIGAALTIVNAVPTKSRRKSSTPRKLHCSKSFNSESSGHESSEFVVKVKDKIQESSLTNVQDSDTEQLPLRWSDDGSQEPHPVLISIANETDDIKQIQEYIKTTVESNKLPEKKEEVSLHIDLVKRGFDLETAKIIERDLLDTPPHARQDSGGQQNTNPSATDEVDNVVEESKSEPVVFEKTLESDCSNNLQIVEKGDEGEDDEIELSIFECIEESANYITFTHDDTLDTSTKELIKLKDKFCMEVCIDDGVSIRLRATPFTLLHDLDPQEDFLNYSYRETEMAVNSISNFEKLYTPLKESMKAQLNEIFDSTLTSLDTPLKTMSPKKEISVAQIVLEVEKVEEKDQTRPEIKKRKRIQSGNLSDESTSESKKSKPEAQILFNSANIQNIDIESVLSKLHGP